MGKIKIIEEVPGLDYQYLIHNWQNAMNIEFNNLEEAVKFCNENNVAYEVDYYHP